MTCPSCSMVFQEVSQLYLNNGCLNRTCPSCGFEWCVECCFSFKNCWHTCSLTKWLCYIANRFFPRNPALYFLVLLVSPLWLLGIWVSVLVEWNQAKRSKCFEKVCLSPTLPFWKSDKCGWNILLKILLVFYCLLVVFPFLLLYLILLWLILITAFILTLVTFVPYFLWYVTWAFIRCRVRRINRKVNFVKPQEQELCNFIVEA